MGNGPCVCGHEVTAHARQADGWEHCAALVCECRGYIQAVNAPLCYCGHMAGMHMSGSRECRFWKLCGCHNYDAVEPVPIEQLRQLADGCSVVVVLVPLDYDQYTDGPTRTAEIIAGDLTNEAHIIMVQDRGGPGLYYVSKHPEKDKIGGSYTTEDTVREQLLQIQAKLERR